MISILFIIMAAICFAVVDVLAHHFPRSIFKNKNPQWWNPKKSWKNSYANWDDGSKRKKILYMFSDASNTFTILTVLFFVLGIVTSTYGLPQSLELHDLASLVLHVVILFFVYLATYLLFYGVVFRK